MLTELDGLTSALDVQQGELISLVGGGGKTTTLFTLGEQLTGTTVLTTTTKMGADQSSGYAVLLDPSDDNLAAELARSGRTLAWQAADGRRAIGISAQRCDEWFDIADNVVTEADGSRKRPFKAPASHEPIIPSRTTMMIACVGASAFDRPIAESCHRPELVAALADCDVHDLLTPARAASVLLSRNGSQKDLPATARFVVALHRVRPNDHQLVDELAARLGRVPLVAVNETDQLLTTRD